MIKLAEFSNKCHELPARYLALLSGTTAKWLVFNLIYSHFRALCNSLSAENLINMITRNSFLDYCILYV